MAGTYKKLICLGGSLASCLLAATVWAQAPVPATGPVPGVVYQSQPPIRRAYQHVHNVLQDNFIGYAPEFVEPPVGFYIREQYELMKAKANPHKFTLYRSDFLAGSNKLSPGGASRFNIMALRLKSWLGPLTIEWSPDEPGLAESRREAVLAILQGGGVPVVPERVVIGPSPYPGSLGTDAANSYNIMITRDLGAPASYSYTPVSGASIQTGGTR